MVSWLILLIWEESRWNSPIIRNTGFSTTLELEAGGEALMPASFDFSAIVESYCMPAITTDSLDP